MSYDLSIIILNFNTPDLVITCLNSLEKFHLKKTRLKTEVIVVDNGSSDDSVSKIKKQCDWVKIIETHKNLGFAAGNNVALRKVSAQYAMLLNSDTELNADSNLDNLVNYLNEHPKTAVCTPKVILGNGQIDWACHRGEATPWAGLTYFTKLANLFPKSTWLAQYHQTYKDMSTIHAVDACSGAAMVIRKSAIDKVGLLDEAFFMYAEDLDWCKRFRDAGYEIVYNPESVIIHHKYQSGLSHTDTHVSKKTNTYFYDTMLQYYDKHYRTKYPFVMRSIIKLFVQYKKATA